MGLVADLDWLSIESTNIFAYGCIAAFVVLAAKMRLSAKELKVVLLASVIPIIWETLVEPIGPFTGLWSFTERTDPAGIWLAAFGMGVRFFTYHLPICLIYVWRFRAHRVSRRTWDFSTFLAAIVFGNVADFQFGHTWNFHHPVVTIMLWVVLEIWTFATFRWLFMREFAADLAKQREWETQVLADLEVLKSRIKDELMAEYQLDPGETIPGMFLG
jgi:hypothetical protein